jgi:hypothetical protein
MTRFWIACRTSVAGLRGWTGALEKGIFNLNQVIDGFTGSAEFQMKYGSLDNVSFVKQLHRNVLDREGEQSGVDGWTHALNVGWTRAQVSTASPRARSTSSRPRLA